MAQSFRMDYDYVEVTRQTLNQGSQQIEERLNQLARDMSALNDGRGNWIQAFTEIKQQWDQQMARLTAVLGTMAEQLKHSATTMQEADHDSAAMFQKISM